VTLDDLRKIVAEGANSSRKVRAAMTERGLTGGQAHLTALLAELDAEHPALEVVR
jgi:hypothetical protein